MKSKYSKEEKEALVNIGFKYKTLSIKQALTLIYWDVFKPKKIELYLDLVKNGMAGIYAFKKANASF